MLPAHAPTYGPLAPMPHRKPYNPAASGPQVQVHDRRQTQVNRGLAAHLVATEIEDPFAKGERNHRDAIGERRSAGRSSCARPYRCMRSSKPAGPSIGTLVTPSAGPRSMQLTEQVDGDPPREGLTDNQIKAWQWLAKSDRAFGKSTARRWFMTC